jgi:BtpA family protein
VCGGSFIRCTALVGATVSAAGMVEAHPHEFLKYRAGIGAQQIKLIAEVHSRHFRWLGETSTADIARMASRVGAAAVEVAHPDEAVNARLVREIKQSMPHLPVILGGHTTHDNVARRLAEADGVFVGACLKTERWDGRVDIERVRTYVDIVARLGWWRWAGWNAGEGKRGPKLVQPQTLKKLHTSMISMPEMKAAAPGTPTRGGKDRRWDSSAACPGAWTASAAGGRDEVGLARQRWTVYPDALSVLWDISAETSVTPTAKAAIEEMLGYNIAGFG